MKQISIAIKRFLSFNFYGCGDSSFLVEKILRCISSEEISPKDFDIRKEIRKIHHLFPDKKIDIEEDEGILISIEEVKNFYKHLFFFYDEIILSHKTWKNEKYLEYRGMRFISSSKVEAQFLIFLIEVCFSNQISEILFFTFEILAEIHLTDKFFHSLIPEYFYYLELENSKCFISNKKEESEKYFSREEIFNMVRRHLSLL